MRKELSNNKRQLLITVAGILFLVSLAYALYKEYAPLLAKEEIAVSKEVVPEYFDFGTMVDSAYCNDFFGLRIPILKGYEAKYKKYDFIEKSIYERDSVPVKPRLTSTIVDHDLLLIEPGLLKIDILKSLKETKSIEAFQNYVSEKTKRERFGADYQLVIRAHNLSGASLSAYSGLFKNLHNPNYGNSKTRTISGITFREYEGQETHGSPMQQTMFSIMGGKNKTITSFFTQIHGFALSIDLFYQTEEQKCILLNMVDTIYFN